MLLKRHLKLAILSLLVLCVAIACLQLDRFICGADTLEKADVVIVLAGGPYTAGRLKEGFRLLDDGYATNMVVSGVEFNPTNSNYIPATEPLLENKPVEVDGESNVTRGSSLLVKRLAAERHWQRVIVVTSGFHWRRTRALFQYDCPAGLDVRICTVNDVDFRDWLRDGYKLRLVRNELYYLTTFYLFQTPYGGIVIGLLVVLVFVWRARCRRKRQ